MQATNKFGMTPLHHAAVHGSSEVIVCLLKGGCPVNQPDNAGRLPLHWTATKVKLELSPQIQFKLHFFKYDLTATTKP